MGTHSNLPATHQSIDRIFSAAKAGADGALREVEHLGDLWACKMLHHRGLGDQLIVEREALHGDLEAIDPAEAHCLTHADRCLDDGDAVDLGVEVLLATVGAEVFVDDVAGDTVEIGGTLVILWLFGVECRCSRSTAIHVC